MNLDELAVAMKVDFPSKPKVEEKVETKVETEIDDDDDSFEETVEADLTSALSMLEDCRQVLEDFMSQLKKERKTSTYLYQRAEELSMDILVFTAPYDVELKPNNNNNDDWKKDL